MKCLNCNSEIKDGMKFCPKCGCNIKAKKIKKISLYLTSAIVLVLLGMYTYNYCKEKYYRHVMSEEYMIETVKGWLEEIKEERGDGGNFNLITDFDRKHLTKEYLALLDSIQKNDPSIIPELVSFERWTTISSKGLPIIKGKMVDVTDFYVGYEEWSEERRQEEWARRTKYVIDGGEPSQWLHYKVRTGADENFRGSLMHA